MVAINTLTVGAVRAADFMSRIRSNSVLSGMTVL
jgi:hypothetical protein